MEAGAVAVAGGVAAIGSSLAVRRGTSTTKILACLIHDQSKQQHQQQEEEEEAAKAGDFARTVHPHQDGKTA